MKGYSIKYCLTAGIRHVTVDSMYGSYPKGHVYRKGDYVYGDGTYHEQLRYGINFFELKEEAIQAAEEKALRKVKSLKKELVRVEALALKARFA